MIQAQNNLRDLPKGWLWTNLENCVDILDSQRVPINAKERETRITGKEHSELYPYYGATGRVGWIDSYLFDEELVLLGEDGAPFFDSAKAKAYIIKGKTWVNNHAHVLRAILGLTTNQFICHYLNRFDFHGYVTGTTRHKLNQAPMRKIPMPLAPFPEQRRIAAKIEELFTKLDSGVEALKKVRQELKRYRQAVLKHAFEGKLTEQWREAHKVELEPASKMLERIAKEREKQRVGHTKKLLPLDKSKLQELPECWEWAGLGQICEEIVKVNPKEKPEKEFVYLDIAAIDNNINKITNPKKYSGKEAPSRARQLVKAGDILFSTVRTYLKNIAMVDEKFDGQIASTGFCVIRPHSIIRRKLIFFLSLGDFFVNPLSKIQRGTSYPAVRDSDVFEQIVPIIPVQEQQEIVSEIEHHFSIADQIEETIEQGLKQSDRLRQSILKRAFEGKLVPQNPEDEPADKLLERIKAEKEKLKAEQKRKSRKELDNVKKGKRKDRRSEAM